MSSSSTPSSSSASSSAPLDPQQQPPAASTASIVENYVDYIRPRIIVSTLAGAIGGASSGYYVGDRMYLYLYSYGSTALVFGTTFFTGAFALKTARGGVDDALNYSASGALNAGAASAYLFRGSNVRIAAGTAAGGLLGACYKFASTFIFDATREAYISTRRYQLQTSVYKPLKIGRPQFPPNDQRQVFKLDLTDLFGGSSDKDKDMDMDKMKQATLPPTQAASEKGNKS
jgi:hypothetical protein